MPIVNPDVHSATDHLMAIDTSSRQVGVAVTDGDRVAELYWQAGPQQSTVLLPGVASLLDHAGVAIEQVGAVAVTTGPGTFNGLRAGMGTAKGLALGRSIPIIGIDSLAATAFPLAIPGRVTVGVAAAGRGRVVFSAWARRWAADDPDEELRRVGDAINGAIDDLASWLRTLPGPVTVAGDLDAAQRAVLSGMIDPGVVWLSPALATSRRPATVAAMALARWRRGDVDDLATLDVTYLHGSSGATVASGRTDDTSEAYREPHRPVATGTNPA